MLKSCCFLSLKRVQVAAVAWTVFQRSNRCLHHQQGTLYCSGPRAHRLLPPWLSSALPTTPVTQPPFVAPQQQAVPSAAAALTLSATMQHGSELSPASTNSTAPEGSKSAAKSMRSLHLHSPAERPRQHVLMQKKSDPLTPTASGDAPCGIGGDGSEAAPASQGAPATECTSASTAAHGPAMSWLPFPAMNSDVSWNDLVDSDDDDMGWNLQPLTGAEPTPVHDPIDRNDGTIPVFGPLIPSFSGECPEDTVKVTRQVVGAGQSDLSTASFGRLESPTPVAVIQDLSSASKHPSRTQFGFALGSALSSQAALVGADGFLGAAAADVDSGAGLHSQWRCLQNPSRDSMPGAQLVVEAKLEAVHPFNNDERV